MLLGFDYGLVRMIAVRHDTAISVQPFNFSFLQKSAR